MYFPSEQEMQEAQISSLKELAKMCREFSDELDLDYFFSTALGRYYYPDQYEETHAGLNTVVGNMIYRLSDHLPLEKRKRITILDEFAPHSAIDDGVRYTTLEDWRVQWEKDHDTIPRFERELSDILLLK